MTARIKSFGRWTWRHRLLISFLITTCVFATEFALLKTPQAQAAYTLANSARFISQSGDNLTKTLTTPTSQNIFTFSAWVKRSKLGGLKNIFGVGTNYSLGFNVSDQLTLTLGGNASSTTAVYRDPAAWIHIVYVQNSTTVSLYVNGTLATSTFTGANAGFNTAAAHQIGSSNSGSYFDGYIADVYFVDGQALTPTSFGATDTNGYWRPVSYSGTYGTNGFHLAFGNGAALGTDTSGNSNTWTVTGLAATDQVTDTPTNSFATGNPISPGGSPTYTQGDLVSSGAATSTFFMSTGKWYWEVTANAANVVAGVTTAAGVSNTTGVANGTTAGFFFDADAGTLNVTTDGSTYSAVATGLTGGRFAYATGASNTFNYGQGGLSGLTFYATPGGSFKYNPAGTLNQTATSIYSTAGSTSWVVPTGVTSATVKAWGAGGGGGAGNGTGIGGAGGGGGFAQGTITTTPGETLTVDVGTAGAKAPANNEAGNGGGYSDINRAGTMLVQAGGGGGGGGSADSTNGGGAGGPGGGSSGVAGSNGAGGAGTGGGGGAGTNAAGGPAGATGTSGVAGAAGAANAGGNGGGSVTNCTTAVTTTGGAGGTGAGGKGGIKTTGCGNGGGGGGGRFGGGGGGSGSTSFPGGGGGGGSDLVTGSGTVETAGSGTAAGNNTDTSYIGSAGRGGTGATTAASATAGNAGLVVITGSGGSTSFSGYEALSTANLPVPTIAVPKNYFDAATYAGTGATQSITNSTTSVPLLLQPDIVWIKDRTTTNVHGIFDSSRSTTTVTIFLTSGTSFATPADWNNSNNSIETIGGGGNGASGNAGTIQAGGGGGSGGYSKVSNLTISGSVTYAVGTAGGDTWFNGASLAASSVGAHGGGGASAGAGGAGGSTTGAQGTTKTAGASGGGGGNGGGGAGCGGSGGGASSSAGVGGTGGDGIGIDTSCTGPSGGAGSGTGGGAGGGSGSVGSAGTNWDASHGSGGGGGGASSSSSGGAIGNGGNGGLYGAGGGGGETDIQATQSAGGSGSQGIIRITYTPATVTYQYPYWSSNANTAETNSLTALTAFLANGFSLGANALFNTSGNSYVSWLWKKCPTVTGSCVAADGVDIETYTGDNTSNKNISHSLGAAPDMVIVKRRDSTGDPYVWTSSLAGATSFLLMDSTAAVSTTNTPWGTGNFSSTQFMVSANATNNANATGGSYVAYLFKGIDGFSKFGTYTGNANADGPFIYTGFKPRWMMFFDTNGTNNWVIYDTARDTYNPLTMNLRANVTNADNSFVIGDSNANGFKLRNIGSNTNTSGHTYIYAAFADIPFYYSAQPAASVVASNAATTFLMGMVY